MPQKATIFQSLPMQDNKVNGHVIIESNTNNEMSNLWWKQMF